MAQAEAVIEAFKVLGGCRHFSEIASWVNTRIHLFGRKWSDFGTCMADMVPLSHGGNPTSTKKKSVRVLKRCEPGVYCLITKQKNQTPLVERRAQPSEIESHENTEVEFWIPGEPATFSTRGEKPWKETLKKGIPEKKAFSKEKGVIADFYLKNLAPNNQPLDLDNLCDPLFSILVNNKKWFWGRRPNIKWWIASKNQSDTTGCKISLFSHSYYPNIPDVFFEGIYQGPLPRKGSDPEIPKWLHDEDLIPNKVAGSELFVSLRFYRTEINIGEIATSPVKATIDCLYPILGGSMSQPDDWKIQKLFVEKNDRSVEGVEIRIGKI